MEKSIRTAIAAMLLCAVIAGASDAAVAGKTRTKSNNSNDRAKDGASITPPDVAQKCATGKHFASVSIKARMADGDPGMTCDAAVVESEMSTCMTGATDWSWGTHQSGASYSSRVIIFRDDGTSGDRVTTSNADSNQGRSVGQPSAAGLGTHINLCSALQKATMAINANPEALAAIQAKVNVQDLHFVYDMLVSNGVPAEMLSDPSEDARVKVNFHWDIVSSETRNMPGAQPKPLQISVDWDQKTNIKVLM